MKTILFVGLVAVACQLTAGQQRRFPDDFVFGTATASYQIEGAWNLDGKGENIWDYMTHNTPHVIKDQSNGDIAADSYHNYKRDVEMMRELGLDMYRFSLSWARILPSGFANEINPAGIEFYNNYINEMLKYNIQPMVTLYHWDLPQKLQELGGFANPMITDWFEDYARVAYEAFGDRVKYWITFNEPNAICYHGYGSTQKAPILNSTAVGTYLCAKHLVLSHAKAYHAYVNDFKQEQKGQCGITYDIQWHGAMTDSEEDKAAAELKRQSAWGIYAEPIFSAEGGYPKEFKQRVADKSAQQGFTWSRLPEFTEEEKQLARGASDFFGVNHYTAYLISATQYKGVHVVPSIDDDVDIGSFVPEEWPMSASSWLVSSPKSLYNVLTHVSKLYNNPVIYVTENGWSVSPEDGLMDDDRIAYYRAKLEEVLDSMDDGANVKGYMAWSLMDNYEWMNGYTERFGLYHVDFEDPARTRTPRKAAFFYKNVIKNHFVDHEYEPETMTMTIDDRH